MTNRALRFALTSLAALALAGAAAVAGEGPASGAVEAASSPQVPRTLAYFANHRHDATLMADLGMLMDACQKGHMTHVIVGLSHCDWLNRPEGKGACVSLNGLLENPPPGNSLMIATGINDSGWIVGQTLGGKPFLLAPMN